MTLPQERSCLSCRINPLWFSHFVLYWANSSVFSEDSTSGDVCVWIHKLLGFFCLPFSTVKGISIHRKICDFNFYNHYHLGSKTTKISHRNAFELCLHKESIWIRTGIYQICRCLEFINTMSLSLTLKDLHEAENYVCETNRFGNPEARSICKIMLISQFLIF